MNNAENTGKKLTGIKDAYEQAIIVELLSTGDKIVKTTEALKILDATIIDEIDKYVMKVTTTLSSTGSLISDTLKEKQDNYLENCVNSTNLLIQAILRTFVSEAQKATALAKEDIAKAAINAENKFKINKLLIYAMYFSIASSLLTGAILYTVIQKTTNEKIELLSKQMEQIQIQPEVKKVKR